MNRRQSALTCLVPMLLLAACGQAAAPAATTGDTVATVNGKPVSKTQFDLYVANLARQSGREVPEDQKPQLLEQFIDMQLAAEAAEKSGIAKTAKVQDQLALARTNVLVDAGLNKYLEEHPVTDAELKPEYDQQIANMPSEYHARHILVDDKAAADAITAELKAGADFAKVAKEKSKDSSKESGGDLGWFTLDSMVKPFADAVTQLQPGQLTVQPVQTQFGWHVIKLEEKRAPTPPTFEEVKDRVRGIVQRKRLQAYLEELRKKAKIEKKI
jgi:peptidyl-prolyl cis-trans isomerase C